MPAIHLAPEAQVAVLQFRGATPRVVPEAESRQTEQSLCKELRSGTSELRGDAFVFGRCAQAYERALGLALPRDTRLFRCSDRESRQGRLWIDMTDLDEHSVRKLRAQHQLQRVSVVVVADDFSWSLGRVLRSLRGVLANEAALLVTGCQAALTESLWLQELRSEQSDFGVARMAESAASWARFVLRRRHFV